MRVAFFGLPLAALLLERDGHELVYVGLCRSEAPGTRRLRDRAITRMQPNLDSAAEVTAIADAKPDLIISWFWTKRLPSTLLTIAPGFGVHPSLLPRHRGPDPTFWTIDCGDPIAGVTAHVLEAEYDTGDILGAATLVVDPTWSAWRLAKKLDTPSIALMRQIAMAYAQGHPPKRVAQNESLATLAPVPTDDDLELDWKLSATDLARRVRAASPYPGAFAFFGEQVVSLLRAQPTDRFPRALSVGEAAVEDGFAVIRCGAGALQLHEGRIDNEEGETPLSSSKLATLITSMTAPVSIA